MGQTLFDKIWAEHVVADLGDGSSLLYIDRVLLHERTGSIALTSLAEAGREVRAPDQALVVLDHIVDTFAGRTDQTMMPGGSDFIRKTRAAARKAGIELLDIGDPRQGIVHVVSAELGLAQPGVVIVCPDSHTCTQGALGALAWGVGSTDCEHALATQTLAARKPKTMRIRFEGTLAPGVTAKDMALYLIGAFGASGGAGYAVEFGGAAVERLDIEARMTLCNMAVEFAAWTALCAPDQKTFDYIRGRPRAPVEADWDGAVSVWRRLCSDPDARYDREININADMVAPYVTWGTSPEHAAPISAVVPNPAGEPDADRRDAMVRALDYMTLRAGQPLIGIAIDAAFLGSCTNSRISDLRSAAAILRGRRVRENVRAICVPGSSQVKAQAEAEGLDLVFRAAGFEWRESGCSMCFYAGGEHFAERARVITSTNRNFENRQGPRVRSHLASPATVAASAIAGAIADPRKLGAV
ncbi:MAG: 3-isopropylmalate dehydratase large subunit [Alphaproteobacteria bacterium]